MTTKVDSAREQEILEYLWRIIPEGSTIYVIHRDTTRNGTSYLDVYAIRDGIPVWLSKMINTLCPQFTFNERHECLAVGGYGYSKEDAVIAALANRLYADARKLRFERM